MNAGKLRRITFFLMLPVAAILIIEGMIYYKASGLSTFETILCTLENTCMTFIARPSISSVYAFKSINDDSGLFAQTIAAVYVFVVIIAPILTTTAVVAGLQAYLLEFWHSIKLSFKNKMFIIGDGDMAKKIATSYAKKYNIQFMMEDNSSSETRVTYLKGKVFAYAVEYRKIVPYLENARIEKGSCIIINFKDYFKNYKAISDTLEYLIQKCKDGATKLYLIDAPIAYRDVFNNLYHGLCRKYKRNDTILRIFFIDANESNAKEFFKDPGFVEKTDKYHHIALTGIGNYGQAVLKELIQYMIDYKLHGTIEVFDRSLERNINNLIYTKNTIDVMDRFELVKPNNDARYSVQFNSDNGPIIGNFYQATAGELRYSQYLDITYHEKPFDEVFFCIDDISANFDCYRIISCYCANDPCKLYFRVSPELNSSFEALEQMSDKFGHLPDGLPDVELENVK